MSEFVLIFGNLDDIIRVREMGIDLLRKEIREIEDEFLDEFFCNKHCTQHHCNGCPSNNDCDVPIKVLDKEIEEIKEEIAYFEKQKYYVLSQTLPHEPSEGQSLEFLKRFRNSLDEE